MEIKGEYIKLSIERRGLEQCYKTQRFKDIEKIEFWFNEEVKTNRVRFHSKGITYHSEIDGELFYNNLKDRLLKLMNPNDLYNYDYRVRNFDMAMKEEIIQLIDNYDRQ